MPDIALLHDNDLAMESLGCANNPMKKMVINLLQIFLRVFIWYYNKHNFLWYMNNISQTIFVDCDVI